MTTVPNAAATSAASRAALLDRIERSWAELRAAADGLDERQLTTPGPDGWAVKDHLAHVMRWDEHLLAVLDGSDGRAVLGLAESDQPDDDAINRMLQLRDAGLSAAEVRGLLAETHGHVVARLEALEPAELERRLAMITGNTQEHYTEHAGWIRALVTG